MRRTIVSEAAMQNEAESAKFLLHRPGLLDDLQRREAALTRAMAPNARAFRPGDEIISGCHGGIHRLARGAGDGADRSRHRHPAVVASLRGPAPRAQLGNRLGRGNAEERIAAMPLDFRLRLHRAHLTGDSFRLPMTQQQMADSFGLTVVHVNRVLKRLRDDGAISGARGVRAGSEAVI